MPLDIGVGIFFSIVVSRFFDAPLSVPFVLLGIGSALLPDIDILPALWRTLYDHRSVLHAPIIYVPISVTVYFFLGPVSATLFALCIYAHLIHDTFGLGWGIRWLWPFSSRHFLLFPEKGRFEKWYMSWTEEDEKKWVPKPDTGQWVKEFYFRPNLVAYIEYGIFFVAMLALFISVYL